MEESTREGIRQEDSQRIKREWSRKREIVRHIATSERFPWQRDRVLRQESWRIVVFLSPQQEKRGKNEGEPFDVEPGTLRTASGWMMATIKKHWWFIHQIIKYCSTQVQRAQVELLTSLVLLCNGSLCLTGEEAEENRVHLIQVNTYM